MRTKTTVKIEGVIDYWRAGRLRGYTDKATEQKIKDLLFEHGIEVESISVDTDSID
jgi:hypothetical protein